MKYNVIISRTYTTELVVEAQSTQEVEKWIDTHGETIDHQELEQCNIVDFEINVEPASPSENEAEELLDLVSHIEQRIHDYRHVEAYIPKEMWDALDKMSSHIVEDED